MGFEHSGRVFGMELRTDEPFKCRNFYNFYKSTFGVSTYALHSLFFILCKEVAVEFVTMAVTFANHIASVNLA